MLSRKGQIWYFSDESPPRKADRPHVWTIAIGLLSPLLALLGLVISWKALDNNALTLKIGQRAYLSCETQELMVDAHAIRAHFIREPDSGDVVMVKFRPIKVFTKIHNTGNTPATLMANSKRAIRYGGNSALAAGVFKERDAEHLESLDGVPLSARADLQLPPLDDVIDDAYLAPLGDRRIQYAGVIRYRDIFGCVSDTVWCVQFRQDDRASWSSPEACSPSWQLAAYPPLNPQACLSNRGITSHSSPETAQ
jgi:hypothetical protein